MKLSIKLIKKELGSSDEIVREMKVFSRNLTSAIKSQIINLPILARRIRYYFKIWVLMSKNSFLVVLAQKKVLLIFLLAKVLRFMFFLTFLYFLVSGANSLIGYSVNQTIFFFLTFMVIDTTTQFFFREVYRFRSLVVSGDFDLVLTKPLSSLFRVLMGGADFIDLVTIPPLYAVTFYYGSLLAPSAPQIYLYIALLISGFLIATSFHIIVLAIGIITLEVDHTIMIYRDVTSMARFPVDIYKQPLRGVLTYLLPIGVMITLPAKALMGFVTPFGIFISVSFGVLTLYLAIRFWSLALQKYSSASS
jgi:ABC-2 type transport system permease protein